jgi:hypothetical protein
MMLVMSCAHVLCLGWMGQRPSSLYMYDQMLEPCYQAIPCTSKHHLEEPSLKMTELTSCPRIVPS